MKESSKGHLRCLGSSLLEIEIDVGDGNIGVVIIPRCQIINNGGPKESVIQSVSSRWYFTHVMKVFPAPAIRSQSSASN